MDDKKRYRAMDGVLEKVRQQFPDDEKLLEMFKKCYANTLDTTVKREKDGSTYVITGDIDAMWLRDSACQLRPYFPLAREEKEIGDILEGLVKRQFFYICTDPYANAFNQAPNGRHWAEDDTETNPWVWERKYEIDSLCYPIQTAWLLWKHTGRTGQFNDNFRQGAGKILKLFAAEQYHEERSPYRFMRKDTFFTDTLSRGGKGALVKSGTGLVWSGFRPSDDACTYGYLIPSNMFAVTALGQLEEIEERFCRDRVMAGKARRLRQEIREGIEEYGIALTEEFGPIYAYEVDGYGQYNLMDDANVPSLLSMNYLGYVGQDPQVAANTRRFLLSDANPCFYRGSAAEGIGSPHTPSRYIWHIALAMQGLTAGTAEEKMQALEMLKDTDGGTFLMHEGFLADDPSCYTREWFSWANALFCELVLQVCGCEIFPLN